MTSHPEGAAARANERRLSFVRPLGAVLLKRILRGIECGRLVVDAPNGEQFVVQGVRPGPQAHITIHRWRCLWRLLTATDIGFAEAYMAGEWSSPNLTALLSLASRNPMIEEPLAPLRLPRVLRRLQHAFNRNTRRGSRRNISTHYDLGNDFYAQWLDAGMNYSSGLFSHRSATLEEAQAAKLDRVVELLEMADNVEVLEIGCGWGSLAATILQRCPCTLTGLTLSTAQLALAQRQLHDLGLSDRVELRLQDYRDVPCTFDRLVSIEMMEAVGQGFWPTYFATLRSRLDQGGIAVLQAITIDDARFDLYRRRPDFIQKYIFPGGMLPTKEIIERESARAGLQVVSVQQFGESYALTLAEWRRRFQESWPRIADLGFDESFKRMWEYYLAYCQAGFATGALQVGLYKLKG